MLMYLNTHTALEQLRCKADEESSRGPRVNITYCVTTIKCEIYRKSFAAILVIN
jgi:hypothetical protein